METGKQWLKEQVTYLPMVSELLSGSTSAETWACLALSHHAASWIERTVQSGLGGGITKGEREGKQKKALCAQSAHKATSWPQEAPVNGSFSSSLILLIGFDSSRRCRQTENQPSHSASPGDLSGASGARIANLFHYLQNRAPWVRGAPAFLSVEKDTGGLCL